MATKPKTPKTPKTIDDLIAVVEACTDRICEKLDAIETHGRVSAKANARVEKYVRTWLEQLAEQAQAEAEAAEAEEAAAKKKPA